MNTFIPYGVFDGVGTFGIEHYKYNHIKSDRDEDKTREELRNNRQNVRSRFNETAYELEEYSRQYIRDYIDKPLEEAIAKLNADIQDIRSTRANKASACRDLERLQEQCRRLIIQIHSSPTA